LLRFEFDVSRGARAVRYCFAAPGVVLGVVPLAGGCALDESADAPGVPAGTPGGAIVITVELAPR
jgi:hypothetical protein